MDVHGGGEGMVAGAEAKTSAQLTFSYLSSTEPQPMSDSSCKIT